MSEKHYVTQIEIITVPGNPKVNCDTETHRCKHLYRLPMMKWKFWCKAYDKQIHGTVYHEKVPNCDKQCMQELKSTFRYDIV